MRPHTPLRLVTINTWRGDGPYRRRIEVMAGQLSAHAPDAVASQEALLTRDGTLSTAGVLATALDMEVCFTPARYRPRDIGGARHEGWSGLALLSRWPISAAETVALPADPEDGERIAQLVTVETPAGPVLIVNTHLTHLRGRDDLRVGQLRVLLEALSAHTDPSLRLLCGDLNARPDSPALEYLKSEQPCWAAFDGSTVAGASEGCATLSHRNAFVRDGVGEHTIDCIWKIARSGRYLPRAVDARVVLD